MTRLRIIHESTRPAVEVERIIRFIVDLPVVDLPVPVAVRVLDAGVRTGGHYSGEATWGNYVPAWAGTACHAMRLTIPADDWDGYGIPRVCWHSTGLRDLSAKHRANGGTFDEAQEGALADIAALHAQGVATFGRWPIYTVADWQECLVHLAAHELRHLVQAYHGRPKSEVDCEEWAAWVLDRWRQEREGA